MQNAFTTIYKGFSITTTSRDVRSASGRAWFNASFVIVPEDSRKESWQTFVGMPFATDVAATANALREAREAIDLAAVGL